MLLGFTTSLIFLKLFAKYFCSRFLSLCLGLCLCLSVSVDLIKYVIFFNSRLEPASSICVEFVHKLIGHSTFSECQIIDPEKCSYVMPFRFNWNILLWLIHSFNFVVVYFSPDKLATSMNFLSICLPFSASGNVLIMENRY